MSSDNWQIAALWRHKTNSVPKNHVSYVGGGTCVGFPVDKDTLLVSTQAGVLRYTRSRGNALGWEVDGTIAADVTSVPICTCVHGSTGYCYILDWGRDAVVVWDYGLDVAIPELTIRNVGAASSMCLDETESLLYIARGDNSKNACVSVYDTRTLQKVRVLGCEGLHSPLDVCLVGNSLYVATLSQGIFVFSRRTGEYISQLKALKYARSENPKQGRYFLRPRASKGHGYQLHYVSNIKALPLQGHLRLVVGVGKRLFFTTLAGEIVHELRTTPASQRIDPSSRKRKLSAVADVLQTEVDIRNCRTCEGEPGEVFWTEPENGGSVCMVVFSNQRVLRESEVAYVLRKNFSPYFANSLESWVSESQKSSKVPRVLRCRVNTYSPSKAANDAIGSYSILWSSQPLRQLSGREVELAEVHAWEEVNDAQKRRRLKPVGSLGSSSGGLGTPTTTTLLRRFPGSPMRMQSQRRARLKKTSIRMHRLKL